MASSTVGLVLVVAFVFGVPSALYGIVRLAVRRGRIDKVSASESIAGTADSPSSR